MTDNQFAIFKLDRNSVEEVNLLQQLSYSMDYQENLEVFRQIIDSFSDGAWGIFIGNELAGYIFFHPYLVNVVKPLNSPIKLEGNENCMYLHDMNISPKFRGQGLPKILFQKFDAKTQAKKYNLQCLITVQNSSDFWKKFGFKEIHSVEHSGYTNGIYMQRIIDNTIAK